MAKIFAIITALILSSATLHAADYKKGLTAYKNGDYTAALEEFRPLAEAGNVPAQYTLGNIYYKGRGVPQDYTEARKWFKLAAEQGFAPAQNAMGILYKYGRGIPQDYTEAVAWFRSGSEQGYAKSQYNLALLYERGNGVPQYYTEAKKLYELAAEQGFSGAFFGLGKLYAKGMGVSQDFVLAHMWVNLISPNAKKESLVKFRDYLANKMTPADISKARILATECVSKSYKNCGY